MSSHLDDRVWIPGGLILQRLSQYHFKTDVTSLWVQFNIQTEASENKAFSEDVSEQASLKDIAIINNISSQMNYGS